MYLNSFDWNFYVNYYKDLNVTNFQDAWNHWCTYGIHEKRLFFIKQKPESENLFYKLREMNYTIFFIKYRTFIIILFPKIIINNWY